MHTHTEMPPWPEDKESALEARLRKKQEAAEDRIIPSQKSIDHAGVGAAAGAAASHAAGPGGMSPTAAGGSGGKKGGGGGMEDLLDLGSSDGDGPSIATAAASLSDHGLLGAPAPATGGGDVVIRVPDEMRPRLAAAFKALVTSGAGVLFENECLQVGVKHEYQGAQGRVGLFFGNKSGGELSAFQATVAAPAGGAAALKIQVGQDVPSTVGAGQQTRQQVVVEAMRPFDYPEAPTLTVSFSLHGRAHAYDLPLPVVPTCFFEPVTLAAGDYMARWRSLEGQNRERQEIVQQPPNFAFDGPGLAAFKQRVVEGLHLAPAPGVDATEASLSVAGSFRTGATGPDGSKLSVGALLRIEFNGQVRAIRVTSRAVHGAIAAALVNTVKALVS